MLILSRRPNESLRITIGGVRLDITVVGLHGNQVRLGLRAPPEVTIDREEIALKKDKERQS